MPKCPESGKRTLAAARRAVRAVCGFFATPGNYKNPFVVRRWIRVLEKDPQTAFRIRPSLALGRRELGFSFASNSLGLRGPEAVEAKNVLLGTSFAMGFGVDCGSNWYELCLDPAHWLNLSLPVGPVQLQALMKRHHVGPRGKALVMYHPNFWKYAHHFDVYARSAGGRDVFAYFCWYTGLMDCSRVAAKLPVKLAREIARQDMLLFETRRGVHLLDTRYCYIRREEHEAIFESAGALWNGMVREFDEVCVVRVPSKQDVAVSRCRQPKLLRLRENSDENWEHFKEALSSRKRVSFHDVSAEFDVDDYLLWDGHFNETGNRKLAKLVLAAVG